MYLFSGKIKCSDCGKNYRGKKDREKVIYICGGYHNKTSNCKRNKIEEKHILDLVIQHIEIIEQNYRRGDYINKFPLNTEDSIDKIINAYVKSIEVKIGHLKINYNDKTDSMISEKSQIY